MVKAVLHRTIVLAAVSAGLTAASFLASAQSLGPPERYTATAVSRLQFFGLRVAGVFIALFGRRVS